MFSSKLLGASEAYVDAADAVLNDTITAVIVTASEYIDAKVVTLNAAIVDAIAESKDYTDEQIALIPAGLSLTDRGDVTPVDYDVNDFTIDYAYHELDISSKVGAGVRYVLIQLTIKTTTVDESFYIGENGNSNPYNSFSRIFIIADKSIRHSGWVLTDAAGKIQYKFSTGTWTSIDMVIRAYITP